MEARIKAGEPLPDLPPPESGPPDSADPGSLLKYWRNDWNWREGREPTPAAREKILQAVLSEPDAIPEVLQLLTRNEAAATAIDRLYDRVPAAGQRDVRAWIYQLNGSHRDEVLADARHVEWERYANDDDPDAAIHAVQTREPEAAAGLFREFAAGTRPGLAVLGARLLMESVPADQRDPWRQQLISAAANVEFPGPARKIATEALTRQPWDGREEWILKSLNQPDLGDVYWFNMPVMHAPDHWIPLLIKLLGGENRAAHDHAVYLLSKFELEIARPDALRPLLPWLMDPKWSGADGLCRLRLIQSMEHVDLPESVEGLIHVLGEEEGLIQILGGDGQSASAACAAGSLAHYKAKQAIPALKSALARCKNDSDSESIIGAIHELDGFSNEEILGALEAVFTAIPSKYDRGALGLPDLNGRGPASPQIGIGLFFNRLPEKKPELLESIARHAEKLEKDKPALAAEFWDLLVESPSPDAAKALAALLVSGDITVGQLDAGLSRRNESSWDAKPFRELLGRPGATGGFAAVLAADPQAMAAALAGENTEAQTAVMAAARLTGDKLDFEKVASFLTAENETVQKASREYLAGRGEPEALALLRKAGKADWDPAHDRYGEFGSLERRLRGMVGESAGPVEIISLDRLNPGGRTDGRYCLFVYPENSYAVRDFWSDRVGWCRLPDGILERVHHYITTYRADELPPLELPVFDGIHYRYAHATAGGVRRVFMNNPPTTRERIKEWTDRDPSFKALVVYTRLVNLFTDAFEGLDLKFSYGNGIEIMVPREKALIETVWKREGDLRVVVKNSFESKHWQGVDPRTGKLLGQVDEPAECAILRNRADLHPKFKVYADYHFRHPWQVRSGDATVHCGEFGGVMGLWLCRAGKEPELIAKGTYVDEHVSPDGKWCVVAKAQGDGWAEPNTAVRINLETKENFPIGLGPADDFRVPAFISAHGKFLIMRTGMGSIGGLLPGPTSATGPSGPEYHLLDPATGALERVTGEFRMISGNLFRPLQKAETPGKDWAATAGCGEEGCKVVVGLYDDKTFTFEPVKQIDRLGFHSEDMWVDEKEGFIYAAAEGDLLKIPLIPK